MEQETTIPIEKAREYCLSGKAVVIFVNTHTGQTYKYKINQDKMNSQLWWVNTFHNNTATQRPYLIGTIKREYNAINEDNWQYTLSLNRTYYKEIQHYKDTFKAMWVRIARGYWKKGTNEDEVYKIMHDGTCGRCGRQLTDEISILRGIGPECARILGIQ